MPRSALQLEISSGKALEKLSKHPSIDKDKISEFGKNLGLNLIKSSVNIIDYNIVAGFLNLSISDKYYINFIDSIRDDLNFGKSKSSNETYVVEFSSPNTNKPLHLGHIRNILLGDSISNIFKEVGNKVHKTQIINDRGIHICKSMVAWQKFGNSETPSNSKLKGDALVGKYYVLFDQQYKKEIADLISTGVSEKQAKNEAPILLEAKEMLIKWEQNDVEVRSLWEQMNAWVGEVDR